MSMVTNLRWVVQRSLIARGLYEALPETVVVMDLARLAANSAVYMWTYEGTNTGPGGTGHAVNFNEWELWILDDDGLIAALSDDV